MVQYELPLFQEPQDNCLARGLCCVFAMVLDIKIVVQKRDFTGFSVFGYDFVKMKYRNGF